MDIQRFKRSRSLTEAQTIKRKFLPLMIVVGILIRAHTAGLNIAWWHLALRINATEMNLGKSS
jgi:hypothetical protein